MFKSNILDTLIIDDSKIVYKYLHILRTHEAYRFLGIPSDQSEVKNCYDFIEANYANKIHSDERLRIVFSQLTAANYTVDIQQIEKLSSTIKLNAVTQKTPLGPEAAYKWENRERWSALLNEKTPEADDILLIAENFDIIETSRFNIFCYDDVSNRAYTPGLNVGCLNGVFRRFSLGEKCIILPELGTKKLVEKNIKLEDLSYYQLFVGNSVRGVLKAALI